MVTGCFRLQQLKQLERTFLGEVEKVICHCCLFWLWKLQCFGLYSVLSSYVLACVSSRIFSNLDLILERLKRRLRVQKIHTCLENTYLFEVRLFILNSTLPCFRSTLCPCSFLPTKLHTWWVLKIPHVPPHILVLCVCFWGQRCLLEVLFQLQLIGCFCSYVNYLETPSLRFFY